MTARFADDACDSESTLRREGFVGFDTVGHLRDDGCRTVPRENGVYVIVRPPGTPPRFTPRGTGARWRGLDPNVPVAVLNQHWVADACVLYIGRAAGTGVRGKLQQRVKRYLRFGQMKNVAHWGGRYLWQLEGAGSTRVAWRPSASPADDEAELQAVFARRFGAMPFANLRTESGSPTEDEE